MARHKVEICGVNTANIKVLSYDEQIELFKKYQSGDLSSTSKVFDSDYYNEVINIIENKK